MISESFRNYLKSLGYGKSTQSMLGRCVEDFLEHARTDKPQELEREQIKSFYFHLETRPGKRRKEGLSARYIAHHVYALRVFFEWLEKTGQIYENPMSGIRFEKGDKPTREALTRAEIQQLFEAAESTTETALLHVFYSAGLRRSEGVNLNREDLKGNQLEVRNGKGGRSRTVPLPASVAAALKDYLDQHPERERKSPFLTNTKGKRLSGNRCNEILKKLLERAGIHREISLHHLRHSIATHLLEAGLKMEQVRDFLGHRSLEATQIYVQSSVFKV